MSLTNTNRESTGTRPAALRDLRFAGTVAAGLVAGVLGVGALSAPLLGWTNGPTRSSRARRGRPDEAGRASAGRLNTAFLPRGAAPSEGTITIPGPGGTTLVVPAPRDGRPCRVRARSARAAYAGRPDDRAEAHAAARRLEQRGRQRLRRLRLRPARYQRSDGDGMPDVWEERWA